MIGGINVVSNINEYIYANVKLVCYLLYQSSNMVYSITIMCIMDIFQKYIEIVHMITLSHEYIYIYMYTYTFIMIGKCVSCVLFVFKHT